MTPYSQRQSHNKKVQKLLKQREKIKQQFGSLSQEYNAMNARIRYALMPDKIKQATSIYKKNNRLPLNAYYRNKLLSDDSYKLKEKLRRKKYYQKNKAKFRLYAKENRNKPKTILARRASAMLNQWVRSKNFPRLPKSKMPNSIGNLVGCSGIELMKHLELMFTPDMNWQNHGNSWHISHLIPVRSFDCSDLTQLKKCFNYSNLFPDTPNNNQTRLNEIVPIIPFSNNNLYNNTKQQIIHYSQEDKQVSQTKELTPISAQY